MDIRPATPLDVPAVVKMVRKLCELHQSWDPARYAFREDVERMYHSWLTDRATDPRSLKALQRRQLGGCGFRQPQLIGSII